MIRQDMAPITFSLACGRVREHVTEPDCDCRSPTALYIIHFEMYYVWLLEVGGREGQGEHRTPTALFIIQPAFGIVGMNLKCWFLNSSSPSLYFFQRASNSFDEVLPFGRSCSSITICGGSDGMSRLLTKNSWSGWAAKKSFNAFHRAEMCWIGSLYLCSDVCACVRACVCFGGGM
jgi:hypothetical protein